MMPVQVPQALILMTLYAHHMHALVQAVAISRTLLQGYNGTSVAAQAIKTLNLMLATPKQVAQEKPCLVDAL